MSTPPAPPRTSKSHRASGRPEPPWLCPAGVADKLGRSRAFVYALFRLFDAGRPGGLRYRRLSPRAILVHEDWLAELIAGPASPISVATSTPAPETTSHGQQ